jgi:hypothetical protein
MVRQKDEETITIEKIVYYPQYPRKEGYAVLQRATQNTTKVSSRREGMGNCR